MTTTKPAAYVELLAAALAEIHAASVSTGDES